MQLQHILEDKDNVARIPEDIRNDPNLPLIFDGAVSKMRKRVAANYKLAVPQYYNGQIQLLLPICLHGNSNKPDLALVVTKKRDRYQGHTCLTLDMAYNNARLIAKPESNWLEVC